MQTLESAKTSSKCDCFNDSNLFDFLIPFLISSFQNNDIRKNFLVSKEYNEYLEEEKRSFGLCRMKNMNTQGIVYSPVIVLRSQKVHNQRKKDKEGKEKKEKEKEGKVNIDFSSSSSTATTTSAMTSPITSPRIGNTSNPNFVSSFTDLELRVLDKTNMEYVYYSIKIP
jgi:hypothetical protein